MNKNELLTYEKALKKINKAKYTSDLATTSKEADKIEILSKTKPNKWFYPDSSRNNDDTIKKKIKPQNKFHFSLNIHLHKWQEVCYNQRFQQKVILNFVGSKMYYEYKTFT